MVDVGGYVKLPDCRSIQDGEDRALIKEVDYMTGCIWQKPITGMIREVNGWNPNLTWINVSLATLNRNIDIQVASAEPAKPYRSIRIKLPIILRIARNKVR